LIIVAQCNILYFEEGGFGEDPFDPSSWDISGMQVFQKRNPQLIDKACMNDAEKVKLGLHVIGNMGSDINLDVSYGDAITNLIKKHEVGQDDLLNLIGTDVGNIIEAIGKAEAEGKTDNIVHQVEQNEQTGKTEQTGGQTEQIGGKDGEGEVEQEDKWEDGTEDDEYEVKQSDDGSIQIVLPDNDGKESEKADPVKDNSTTQQTGTSSGSIKDGAINDGSQGSVKTDSANNLAPIKSGTDQKSTQPQISEPKVEEPAKVNSGSNNNSSLPIYQPVKEVNNSPKTNTDETITPPKREIEPTPIEIGTAHPPTLNLEDDDDEPETRFPFNEDKKASASLYSPKLLLLLVITLFYI